MPAVPVAALAVSAYGAYKGAKNQSEANKIAKQGMQQSQSNATNYGNMGSEQYGKKNAFQDNMMGQYQSMLDKVRSGEADMGSAGGWVGPDYSGVQGDWENLKNTGGWSDRDKAAFSAVSNAPISGFYTGMKNDLARSNAATGGYAGYNSQSAKLSRDAARSGYLTALNTENTMQSDIRNRKESALQALTQMAQSQAHSTPGSAGSFGSEMDILGRMQSLGGSYNDIPYWQLQQGGQGQALGAGNTYGQGIQQPSPWLGFASNVAQAGLGAYNAYKGSKGGGIDYGNLRGEGGQF